MSKLKLFAALGAGIMTVSACASGAGGPSTPNEFRVVKKAPLTVPPNYQLRPPPAGGSVPTELDPSRVNAVPAAFGADVGATASMSERALVASAGANVVSGIIRTQVDYEETRTIRKSPSIVDRVLFWRSDDSEDAESAGSDNATGGEPVIIEQDSASPRIKLPGT